MGIDLIKVGDYVRQEKLPGGLSGVGIASDLQEGQVLCAQLTLGSAGTVTVITLPDWVRGVKLYSAAEILFALNEAPVAKAAASGTPLDDTDFGAGGIALAEQLEVRLLPRGTARTLQLRSATGAAVVDVELFG